MDVPANTDLKRQNTRLKQIESHLVPGDAAIIIAAAIQVEHACHRRRG